MAFYRSRFNNFDDCFSNGGTLSRTTVAVNYVLFVPKLILTSINV